MHLLITLVSNKIFHIADQPLKAHLLKIHRQYGQMWCDDIVFGPEMLLYACKVARSAK